MVSSSTLKGHLELIVLHHLQQAGKQYGYQIIQSIKESANNELLLTEGALYPCLKKLLAKDLVLQEEAHIGLRIRKYYAISEKGSNYLTERVSEQQQLNRLFHKMGIYP